MAATIVVYSGPPGHELVWSHAGAVILDRERFDFSRPPNVDPSRARIPCVRQQFHDGCERILYDRARVPLKKSLVEMELNLAAHDGSVPADYSAVKASRSLTDPRTRIGGRFDLSSVLDGPYSAKRVSILAVALRLSPAPQGWTPRLVVVVRPAVPRPAHELLAENVRRIAQAKGVSFVFLAGVAGISTERLLAIFSGEFDPDLDLINKLADGLGVALSELFADSDPERN
jgi:hypothetical protein